MWEQGPAPKRAQRRIGGAVSASAIAAAAGGLFAALATCSLLAGRLVGWRWTAAAAAPPLVLLAASCATAALAAWRVGGHSAAGYLLLLAGLGWLALDAAALAALVLLEAAR